MVPIASILVVTFYIYECDRRSVRRYDRLLVEFVCLELSEMDLILGN